MMRNWLVITGGSQGIGEQTIALFREAHWNVINISRSHCQLEGVINLTVDLSVTDGLQKIAPLLKMHLQGAEKICLVHNAAVFENDSVQTVTTNALQSTLNVNLFAPINLNQLMLPYMPAGSSIIYIGSTLSEQAVAGRASYIISKHAIVGLMRATCQDVADQGIHTCCICPGFVNTKMLTDNVNMEVFEEFIKTKVIAQRLIEPEEIAECIYFAATHPLMNGAVWHANLGQVTT